MFLFVILFKDNTDEWEGKKIYQFGNGLIKCVDCGKNYRGKLERKKCCYICGGYSNKQTQCIRYQIEEEQLIYITTKHLSLRGRQVEEGRTLKDYIERIEVSGGEKTIKIYYIGDSTISIVSPNRLLY